MQKNLLPVRLGKDSRSHLHKLEMILEIPKLSQCEQLHQGTVFKYTKECFEVDTLLPLLSFGCMPFSDKIMMEDLL